MAGHRWDPRAPRVRVVHPIRVGDELAPGTPLTPGLARGPGWVRTSSGCYVPASTDRALAQQRVIEAAARVPSYGAVTGWAACLLAGAAWFDGLARDGRTPLPVPVVVGPRGSIRPGAGIAISYERIPEWEVWERYGVRAARPERAVFDEMRRWSEREALVVLESAVAAAITSPQRMAAYVATHPSARRCRRVLWAPERVRGRVRSPLEVRVRTVAEEDAGYARLLVNPVVLGPDGRRIGEVDQLDVESCTVIEVDGADHREAEQQSWDISKEELLRQVGLEVARVTGRQARDPVGLARRLAAVRRRSRFEPPDRRRWRLAPPRPDAESLLQAQEALALRRNDLRDAG